MEYFFGFLLVALQFGDWWSTKRALAAGSYEVNPVIAAGIAHLGFVPTMLIKVAVAALISVLLVLQHNWIDTGVLAVIDAAYAWVVYNNYSQVK